MRARGTAIAALALVALVATARAGELELLERTIRLDVTSTTFTGYRTEPDERGEILERLNVAAGLGKWSARLRFDSSTFLGESAPLDDRYTLEKISIDWTHRDLVVTVGDSYISFGRGLALSLRKVDELGIDTTLQGAKVLVHGDRFGGTVGLGVANIQNVDETTGKSIDDPYDLVAGAEGHMRLGDAVTAGVHGAAIGFRQSQSLVPTDPYEDRVIHVGATLDGTRATERFGFYLEGLAQLRQGPSAGEDTRGFGLYGTGTARVDDDLVLLVEGKAYGDLAPLHPELDAPEFDALAYNQPPTAERVTQILENPQRDIAGARLRADWTISTKLLAYANYGAFRDWLGYDDPENVGKRDAGTIHDPYIGAEARWDEGRSWVIGTAGWRGVVLAGSHLRVREDVHFQLDAAQALNRCWSLTFNALHVERHKHESPIFDRWFREGTMLAGVRIVKPALSAALGYDYTTEPTQPKRDYWNGNLQWNITQSSNLRLLVGGQRGGLRCVSGVCRVVPQFEGVRLTATLRY